MKEFFLAFLDNFVASNVVQAVLTLASGLTLIWLYAQYNTAPAALEDMFWILAGIWVGGKFQKLAAGARSKKHA